MRLNNNLNKVSQILITIALISIVIASRTLGSVPNVSATAAVALFAGYLFGYQRGILITVTGMLVTDVFFKGFYDAGVMVAVYAGLSAPALLARSKWNLSKLNWLNNILTIAGKSLLGSLLFFVISNLAVWLFSGMYAMNINGLVNCFVLAVPFFKLTWIGDLAFNAMIFASFYLCLNPSKAPLFAKA